MLFVVRDGNLRSGLTSVDWAHAVSRVRSYAGSRDHFSTYIADTVRAPAKAPFSSYSWWLGSARPGAQVSHTIDNRGGTRDCKRSLHDHVNLSKFANRTISLYLGRERFLPSWRAWRTSRRSARCPKRRKEQATILYRFGIKWQERHCEI